MPLGDLVVGRTASIAAEGLLVKLPGQDAPALLPRQVAYSGIAVGDEICDLLVVWLYPDGSASVVVPEATAQELVATGQFPSLEKQDDTSMAPVRSKGRWGAAKEPKEPSPELENSKDSEASRLMPFLVAGHATDAPTYASVALVKPETTLSYVSQSSATKSSSANKDPAKEQESEDTIYSRKQLLTLRQSMLMMQDAGESASSPLPTSMPCKEEELDSSMLQMVICTRQLPVWWGRCGKEAKRQAFRLACRTGRLRIVKAIYAGGDVGIDTDFLAETVKEMCNDAQSSAGFKPGKKHKRSEDARGLLLSRAEAQAVAAWGRAGAGAATAGVASPAAEAIAWLLEHGAPVGLLLPEAPGPEALSARLRGLGIIAEYGPSISEVEHIVEAVAGCLKDPEASGRLAAAQTLARFGTAAGQAPRALPRLRRLVQSAPRAVAPLGRVRSWSHTRGQRRFGRLRRRSAIWAEAVEPTGRSREKKSDSMRVEAIAPSPRVEAIPIK
ncbi:unnamed protein product [Durusdinium trenchii]|uniref:Uncharacterized protein n=1 Tax=Durusdinium trenchii TaxID=1381693 RepID=A0ABP0J3K6_9DINO